MNRGRRLLIAAHAVAGVLLGTALSRADDDLTDLQGLLAQKVVTSASKRTEDASSAPALVTSISTDALRQHGITTLGEAIDFLSVGVHTSDNLNEGEMGARGVVLTGDRGSHFLLLVDGHSMNEPLRGSTTFGHGAGIPLELIDHIEVVVGPGSVLYGSNAMLGLINVVTKRAKDYPAVRVIAESEIPTTLRAGAGVGETFELFGREGEITSQVEYFGQRGPSFYLAPENTGFDNFTGSLGRYSRSMVGTGIWGGRSADHSLYADAPAGVVRLALGHTELDLRGSFYRHAAPTGPGDFDDPATSTRESRGSFDLRHRVTVSTILDVSVRLYGDFYHLSSDAIVSRGALCPFGLITCDFLNDGSALWGGAEVQTTWDWFKNERFVTVAGLDARARKFTTSSDVLNIGTGRSVYPPDPGLDVVDGTLGAYVQQTWNATPTISFNGGARADWDNRFPVVLTPRFAASWKAWKGGVAKAAYAEAFRAPSWDETNVATPFRIVADPLQPEKVRSIEAGADQKVGPYHVFINAFYAQWTNLVELATLSDAETIGAIRDGKTAVPYTPGTQLTQYRNVSEIQNYGMSTGLDGSLAFDRVRYGLSITGARADRHQGDSTQRLAVAPQIFGNARVSVALGAQLPTLALATRLMGQRAADHAFDGGFTLVPYAPPQLDLRFTISGAFPWVKGLAYRAFVNYAAADRGPYVIGPVTSALPTQRTAQLLPVDTFRTAIGLEYALP